MFIDFMTQVQVMQQTLPQMSGTFKTAHFSFGEEKTKD